SEIIIQRADILLGDERLRRIDFRKPRKKPGNLLARFAALRFFGALHMHCHSIDEIKSFGNNTFTCPELGGSMGASMENNTDTIQAPAQKFELKLLYALIGIASGLGLTALFYWSLRLNSSVA